MLGKNSLAGPEIGAPAGIFFSKKRSWGHLFHGHQEGGTTLAKGELLIIDETLGCVRWREIGRDTRTKERGMRVEKCEM